MRIDPSQIPIITMLARIVVLSALAALVAAQGTASPPACALLCLQAKVSRLDLLRGVTF